MADLIEGYESEIYQALWRRPQYMGAPRLWSYCWLAICLYAGLVTMVLLGMKHLLIPLGAWALGQAILVGLTRWDEWWDDILIAKLARRYQTRYRA